MICRRASLAFSVAGWIVNMGKSGILCLFPACVFDNAESGEAALGGISGSVRCLCRKSALAEVMSAALMDGMSMEPAFGGGDGIGSKAKRALWHSDKAADQYLRLSVAGMDNDQRYFSPQFSSPYPLIFTAFLLIALCVLALLSLIIHRNFIRPIPELNAGLLRLSDDPLAAQS